VAQPLVPTAAPGFSPTQLSYAVPIEAMDMLSHCGILWAQRGCPRKALMYLLAASSFYDTLSVAQQKPATASNDSSSGQDSSIDATTAGTTAVTADGVHATAGAGAEAVNSETAAVASDSTRDSAVDVDDVTLQLQQQHLPSDGTSTTVQVDSNSSSSSSGSSGPLDSATWSAIEVLQTHVLFFLAQVSVYITRNCHTLRF
jgi:cytoskeletal protein RodZ